MLATSPSSSPPADGDPHARPGPHRHGLILGVGNVFCGDDGIGPAVARAVFAQLEGTGEWWLEEISGSPIDVVERLAGYQRAVIIDALVDWDAPIGTVVRACIEESFAGTTSGSHAVTFGGALALARAAGLELPRSITFYGVVVRGPLCFGEALSPELAAKLDEIARQIASEIAGTRA